MYFKLALVALCLVGLTACTAGRKASQKAAMADADNDGIRNADDKCPAEPETLNGYRDADGCPDAIPAKPALRTIHYGVNEQGTPEGTKTVVSEVAQAMQQYPGMKIRVEAHTDSYGTESYNLDLSKRRAESIKQMLVKTHGIDAMRVEAVGFGMSRPAASFNTREGRIANRRIEFTIVEGWPPRE